MTDDNKLVIRRNGRELSDDEYTCIDSHTILFSNNIVIKRSLWGRLKDRLFKVNNPHPQDG